MLHSKEKGRILIFISLIACVAMTLVKPIPQDPAYHSFADRRTILGVPNFWNVISNAAFLLAGAYAIFRIRSHRYYLNSGYNVFFIAILFTAFGSAWYHLAPDNANLIYDRLPMTFAFMGLFSGLVTELVSERWGRRLLWPLCTLGVLSICYWYLGEINGQGDLRLYALVQYLPGILMPMILIMYPARQRQVRFLWLALVAYVISKFFEAGDEVIYLHTPFLSGHTLKHVAAACSPLFVLMHLQHKNNVHS